MSEWIKCSDNLPGDRYDGVPVIVAVRRGCAVFSETDVWLKAYHQADAHFDFWKEKVTHWQPLPSPPTE